MLNFTSFETPVPNSINVTVTAPNTQIVGQSLTLECSVTTVRGITSRIDVKWITGSKILQRLQRIRNTGISNGLALYEAIYDISQVSTSDDGRVYQCKVAIITNPQLIATDSVTLDVTGNSNHICS